MNSEDLPKEQRLVPSGERSLATSTTDLVARGLESLQLREQRILRFPEHDSVGTVYGCTEYRGWHETKWEFISDAVGTVTVDTRRYPGLSLELDKFVREVRRVVDVSFLETFDEDCLIRFDMGESLVTEDQLRLVTRFRSLRELTWTYPPMFNPVLISDSGLLEILALPSLQYLNIEGAEVSPSGLRRLGASHGLRGVRVSCHRTVCDENLFPLRALTALEKLDLSDTFVSDAGLANLEYLTRLKELHLTNTTVTGEGLRFLRELKGLEALVLTNTNVTDAGLVHLAYLPALRMLYLDSTQITDAGLAHLSQCSLLTILSLDNTRITDRGLAHLSSLPLRFLNLREDLISDAGLAHLSSLPLRALELSGTRITDAGLAHLRNMRTLEWLDLSGTLITDVGLAPLANLRAMREFTLFGTRVTHEGAAALKRALPEATIKFGEY